MILIIIAATLILSYLVFLLISLGFHQRLPLALMPISLEKIPDRAARKYGNRILFTTDEPCAWEVPSLKAAQHLDPFAWSAIRIRETAGYLARMISDILLIEHGDRIAILKRNHLDIHIFNLGIIRAGGIACPINGKFSAEKLGPYLINIGAKIMISDCSTLLRLVKEGASFGCAKTIIVSERRENNRHELLCDLFASTHPTVTLLWIEEELQKVSAESPAITRGKDEPFYLVHSSGTTGFPKAVILKNGAQSHAVRGWLCFVHVGRRKDKGYLAVPNKHQAVILSFNSLLLLGLRVHWAAECGRENFDPEGTIRNLAKGKFTGFFGFPILYTMMKEIDFNNYDLSAMRFWASTADATHEAIMKKFLSVGGAFRKLGIPVSGSVCLDAQGSSEVGTPSVIRYTSVFTRKFARRIGKPGSMPFGPQIRITKTNGAIAKTGEVGRLEVKGKTVFDAYWNNHAMTYKAIRDKWFFTGDVARKDADGNIIQLDREVDVIHTNAGDIYSLLIEEKVHKHPNVFDACVYAARQEDGAQLPAAAIALKSGASISSVDILNEINLMLEKKEQLCRLEIMAWEDFPVGITGKTLKRIFRERTEHSPVPEANLPIILENYNE